MEAGIIAIIAALLAPIGAYLVAARRFSGRIETSAAQDLWAESSEIRKWSLERIRDLSAHIVHLEERIETLEHENNDLHEQVRSLRTQLIASEGNA